MGLITPEAAGNLAPDKAVDYLNGLDWHLYTGSYSGKKGRSAGQVNADL